MFVSETIQNKHNNFDIIRLCAAVLVLFSHSFPLSGRPDEPWRTFSGYDSFGTLAVEVFFVISGLLITKSWMDNPHIGVYFKKRFLRIFPAFAVVTLLSVFVLGPVFTKIPLNEYFGSRLTWTYLKNPLMALTQYNLPGVFEKNIYPVAVNGSIWSLPLEILMYIGVLALGLMRVFKKRGLVLMLVCLVFLLEFRMSLDPGYGSRIILYFTAASFFQCTIFFCMGALVWLYREKIHLNGTMAAVSLFFYLATCGTPVFHFTSYFTVTYLVVWLAFQKCPAWLNVRKYGDFSYGVYLYAFPVQQSIMAVFGPKLPFLVFFGSSLVVTAIFAVLSWHFIEKPAMKLKPGKVASVLDLYKTKVPKKKAI